LTPALGVLNRPPPRVGKRAGSCHRGERLFRALLSHGRRPKNAGIRQGNLIGFRHGAGLDMGPHSSRLRRMGATGGGRPSEKRARATGAPPRTLTEFRAMEGSREGGPGHSRLRAQGKHARQTFFSRPRDAASTSSHKKTRSQGSNKGSDESGNRASVIKTEARFEAPPSAKGFARLGLKFPHPGSHQRRPQSHVAPGHTQTEGRFPWPRPVITARAVICGPVQLVVW